MGYFQVRYDSRVVIYEHKMFIRLDTDQSASFNHSKVVLKIVDLITLGRIQLNSC